MAGSHCMFYKKCPSDGAFGYQKLQEKFIHKIDYLSTPINDVFVIH